MVVTNRPVSVRLCLEGNPPPQVLTVCSVGILGSLARGKGERVSLSLLDTDVLAYECVTSRLPIRWGVSYLATPFWLPLSKSELQHELGR